VDVAVRPSVVAAQRNVADDAETTREVVREGTTDGPFSGLALQLELLMTHDLHLYVGRQLVGLS
jgi:hypothetical protein